MYSSDLSVGCKIHSRIRSLCVWARLVCIQTMCEYLRPLSLQSQLVHVFAFTRYSWTSQLLCTSESSLSGSSLSALPTLLHDCCTTIAQNAPSPPIPLYMPYTIQTGYWQFLVKANSRVCLVFGFTALIRDHAARGNHGNKETRPKGAIGKFALLMYMSEF